MQRYRQIRLCVQLGNKETAYHMTLRTVKGRETSDRRLSTGRLPGPTNPMEPQDVIETLQRCIYDLRRRHGISDPAQRSGAPGGGGGRPTSEVADTMPLFVISRDGQTLDYDGNPI